MLCGYWAPVIVGAPAIDNGMKPKIKNIGWLKLYKSTGWANLVARLDGTKLSSKGASKLCMPTNGLSRQVLGAKRAKCEIGLAITPHVW